MSCYFRKINAHIPLIYPVENLSSGKQVEDLDVDWTVCTCRRPVARRCQISTKLHSEP